jgi:hypothetical protein
MPVQRSRTMRVPYDRGGFLQKRRHGTLPAMLNRAIAMSVILALVLIACGDDDGSGGDASSTPGAELVGRWAHFDAVAYEDDTMKTVVASYGFNDFTEEDGRIIDSASFCFSEQTTDQAIEISLSDVGTQAITPPSTPLEVTAEGDTLTIRRPPTPTPLGVELDDPVDDPLPTDADDPRLSDDDGDGQPGVTVTIEVPNVITGEIYVARKEVFEYEATLAEPDVLRGSVIDTSEQFVIGASNPMFLGSGSGWVQNPDPAKSPLVLIRVDSGWDCERLAAEAADMFPAPPGTDW